MLNCWYITYPVGFKRLTKPNCKDIPLPLSETHCVRREVETIRIHSAEHDLCWINLRIKWLFSYANHLYSHRRSDKTKEITSKFSFLLKPVTLFYHYRRPLSISFNVIPCAKYRRRNLINTQY